MKRPFIQNLWKLEHKILIGISSKCRKKESSSKRIKRRKTELGGRNKEEAAEVYWKLDKLHGEYKKEDLTELIRTQKLRLLNNLNEFKWDLTNYINRMDVSLLFGTTPGEWDPNECDAKCKLFADFSLDEQSQLWWD